MWTAHVVPVEFRRGGQSSWSWSYTWLRAASCVLGTKPLKDQQAFLSTESLAENSLLNGITGLEFSVVKALACSTLWLVFEHFLFCLLSFRRWSSAITLPFPIVHSLINWCLPQRTSSMLRVEDGQSQVLLHSLKTWKAIFVKNIKKI